MPLRLDLQCSVDLSAHSEHRRPDVLLDIDHFGHLQLLFERAPIHHIAVIAQRWVCLHVLPEKIMSVSLKFRQLRFGSFLGFLNRVQLDEMFEDHLFHRFLEMKFVEFCFLQRLLEQLMSHRAVQHHGVLLELFDIVVQYFFAHTMETGGDSRWYHQDIRMDHDVVMHVIDDDVVLCINDNRQVLVRRHVVWKQGHRVIGGDTVALPVLFQIRCPQRVHRLANHVNDVIAAYIAVIPILPDLHCPICTQ
mmetsp:Transcript_30504/g.48936  ORF Transcript_30504/g.48936 Transcript_30504/m.48936 type:complete len:249 (-) Transcript_30504:770-1516(-)